MIFGKPTRHAAGATAQIQDARFRAKIEEVRPRRAIGGHRAEHTRRGGAELIFQCGAPAISGGVLQECLRIIAAQ